VILEGDMMNEIVCSSARAAKMMILLLKMIQLHYHICRYIVVCSLTRKVLESVKTEDLSVSAESR
jgi:hypothetical protein